MKRSFGGGGMSPIVVGEPGIRHGNLVILTAVVRFFSTPWFMEICAMAPKPGDDIFGKAGSLNPSLPSDVFAKPKGIGGGGGSKGGAPPKKGPAPAPAEEPEKELYVEPEKPKPAAPRVTLSNLKWSAAKG